VRENSTQAKELATIVESLRTRIVNSELPSGTKLREEELAASFGVSRARLREAFLLLEDRGLIDRQPNRGATVAGLNLEKATKLFDLRSVLEGLAVRLATENATFFNPNLQLGFPPSALLSFYLQQSLGSPRATELLLTKTEISPQEALSLGLISQVVADKNLESSCLAKLRELSRIPKHTLVETRSILQPSIDVIKKHLDEGFEGSLRCLYKMKS